MRRAIVVGLVALVALALAPAAHAQPRELKRLRVLLVINSDTDPDTADSVRHDRNNMLKVLEKYIPGRRRTIDVLQGKRVTREDILRYYRNLKTGPDESLLFYYAGHGAIDSKLGHCLTPRRDRASWVPRADVRKAMRNTGAGLVVLLTDCCSTVVNAKPLPKEPGPGTSYVMRCLFFQHRGLVDITAAQDGTGSYGDPVYGGVFTSALISLLPESVDELDRDHDGFVTWKQFFPRLTRETEDRFQDLVYRAKLNGYYVDQKTQRPRAFALPDPPTKPKGQRHGSRFGSRDLMFADDSDFPISLSPALGTMD
jgi:hypothetical protein